MRELGASGSDRLLVVVDRLRPGDVILSTGAEKASRKIRLADGAYSHAAVVFNGLGFLEATYDETFSGVRLTPAKPDDLFAGRVDGSDVTLWALPDVTRCDVYRFVPRTAEEASLWERLPEVVEQSCAHYLFQPYASPQRLAEACLQSVWHPAPWLARLLAYRAVRAALALIISRATPRQMREGYFCSQLVALVYARAGLRIVNTLRPMPRDLAAALSRVQPNPVIGRAAVEDLVPLPLREFISGGVEPAMTQVAYAAQKLQDSDHLGFVVLERALVQSVAQIRASAEDLLLDTSLEADDKGEIRKSLEELSSQADELRKRLRDRQRTAAPAENDSET
jgi:hypothetical protein